MTYLLQHPALERFDPSRRNLVRLASPLGEALNPFVKDGVTIVPAILYDGTFNSKVPVAYGLITEGIRRGLLTSSTKAILASSGNTGLGAAQLCKALGLYCEVVMPNDTPDAKVGQVSALGNPINAVVVSSSTVQYAKEKGEQPGWFNIDQYGDIVNLLSQYKYFAPQLLDGRHGRIDLVVGPGGTLGTTGGLAKYATEHGLSTKIVLALCENGHEIPGARDEIRVRRDVTYASVDDFEHRMTATRTQAFLASYAMFAEVEWTQGGPTSGLALSVALRFLQKHKIAGTLDQFRGPDGKINLVFLCPDDYRIYGALYKSTLNGQRDFSLSRVPVGSLLDETA